MEVLAIALVHLVAVISPGANFLVVSRNALSYSRQSGLFTARGVALGSLVYITIGLLGFATLISHSPLVFNLIKLVGVIYFVRAGIKALASLRNIQSITQGTSAEVNLSPRAAFTNGLVTALSNPTSALYFLALFTTFVRASAPVGEKVFTAFILVSISFTWYTFIALTFSQERVRKIYRRFERWLNGLIGLLWLGLAVKLLTAS